LIPRFSGSWFIVNLQFCHQVLINKQKCDDDDDDGVAILPLFYSDYSIRFIYEIIYCHCHIGVCKHFCNLQSQIPETMLTAMETNQMNSYLVTGDNHGFVCVWDIENYALSQVEEDPPKRTLE